MAVAVNGVRLRALLRQLAWPLTPGNGSRRLASHLPKHLLPGTYPKTPEEQAAAAKKYNLTLEDYKTYADDGLGYGDYPRLPDQSAQEKNPWYEWDYPDLRRNFGEALHRNFDLYVRTRVDTSPTIISWHIMKRYFWGFIGIMLGMGLVGEVFPAYQPVGPKQFPYHNVYLENRTNHNIEPLSEKHYEI
ncbi:NADH dehydrogenase [ubiquinone] 1 beta subcomplex subunit 8, mitochondrial [Pituophis catenifer annectens]|uniref:NADH dehydrogenase [ubiquinone] 1 beta subcomplex subunit 8, mitochondrial n=1 Tax=Pituophis catenifer annectens TaxID=94852 RepID=UPI003996A346